MSTRDGEQIIDGALDRLSNRSLTEFFEEVGIGGISFALILNITEGIDSAFGLVIGVFIAIGGGIVDLLDATFGGYVRLIEAGVDTAIISVTDGTTAILGPFVPFVTVGIAMGTVYMILWAFDRMEFNPIAVIFGRRSR